MTLQDNLLDIPSEHAQNVYGQFDAYVKKIERTTGATVVSRDGGVKLIGNERGLCIIPGYGRKIRGASGY